MKTYIWDLDGTVIDSYDLMTENIFQVFKDYGVNKETIRTEILETSITAYFIRMSQVHHLVITDLYTTYKQLTTKTTPSQYPLIEGVKEVLIALKRQGATHYMYTHRDGLTQEILKAHDIEDLFDEIVTSENDFKRKPSPEALKYLIKKYNLDIHETCYVGDRILDVTCGLNAGIKTVFYNREGASIQEAHKNISHYNALWEVK